MPQKIGLGKGLSALIPAKKPMPPDKKETEQKKLSSSREIAVSQIKPHPNQPRKYMNDEKLKELASSIKEHGILQPLVINTKNQLVIGQRRLEAAKIAGLKKVPIVIREEDEAKNLEMSIIENIQREDLNPIEKAEAFKLLLEKFEMTQNELGRRLGKDRSSIANTIRMLDLPFVIQKALKKGKISEGHCKYVLSLTSPEKQIALYKTILKHGLTVAKTEIELRKITGIKKKERKKKPKDPILTEAESRLGDALGARVEISRRKRVGNISIEFYSYEELKGILDRFGI